MLLACLGFWGEIETHKRFWQCSDPCRAMRSHHSLVSHGVARPFKKGLKQLQSELEYLWCLAKPWIPARRITGGRVAHKLALTPIWWSIQNICNNIALLGWLLQQLTSQFHRYVFYIEVKFTPHASCTLQVAAILKSMSPKQSSGVS